MKNIKEWGNNGRSMGGGFVGGSDNSQRAGSFHRQKFYSEPYSHADTLFSQKSGLSSSHFKGEYYEDPNILEDEEDKNEEESILEYRVFKNNSYSLIETLDEITKASGSDISLMNYKLNKQSSDQIQKAKNMDDLDDLIDEMSAGGIAGPATPLGYTSKGKPETPAERKRRQKFNKEKSYPYSLKESLKEWKSFLNEAALGFGPGGLSELGDMTFKIVKDNDYYYTIKALDNSGNEIGYVDLDGEFLDKCGVFMTHSGINDPDKGSFGPFLYDLAIEFGSLISLGVISSDLPSGFGFEDYSKSKSSAINVWLYYYNKRTDVQKSPLRCAPMMTHRYITDHTRGYKRVYSNNGYAYLNDRYLRHKLDNPSKELQNKVNAISTIYSKDPILLNQLKSMGKLEDTTEIV